MSLIPALAWATLAGVFVAVVWWSGYRAGVRFGGAYVANAVAEGYRVAITTCTGSDTAPELDGEDPMSLVYTFMQDQAETLEEQARLIERGEKPS